MQADLHSNSGTDDARVLVLSCKPYLCLCDPDDHISHFTTGHEPPLRGPLFRWN